MTTSKEPANLSDPSKSVEASRALACEIARLAADRHCRDIVILELAGLSPVALHFVISTGTSNQQIRAVEALIRRFPDSPANPRLAAHAAGACLHREAYDPALADRLLTLAIQGATDRRDRRDWLLRRARLLTWHLDDLKQAASLYRKLYDPARLKPGGAHSGR